MLSSLLVSCALRGSIMLLVGLVAYVASTRASAAARRSVLLATLVASLAVPAVAVFAPAWHVAPPPALAMLAREPLIETAAPTGTGTEARVSGIDVDRSAEPAPTRGVNRPVTLLVVWLFGVLTVLTRALASRARVRRLVRDSEPVDAVGWDGVVGLATREAGAVVEVRISAGVDSPAVTGVVRPTVLLPRGAERWSRERLRVVLVHELAHVQCRDPLAQILADIACAVHWWNPLAWVVAARLRVERELAADDAVLAAGIRPSSYAEELLAVAGASTAGALAMAERTVLGSRVVAILAARRARGPLEGRGRTLLLASGLAVGATAACVAPEAAATPTVTAASVGGSPAPTSNAKSPQVAADEVVASLAREWAAESAVVLVLDVATGEILADAGRRGGHAFDVARARAIVPGSTLKAVTIAAALETGAITPGQRFECGPAPRVYGKEQLHDAAPHGTLDVAHVLAVSSNIGTSHIFDALGGERLSTWLTRFHLADAPKLEGAITGTFPGTLTTGSFEGATVAIGEGSTATPLQMAAAYAALANDGVYHAPTTVHGAASPGERLVSSATATEVMSMLGTVVTDPTGTGELARVDGVHVAGKTGTADATGPDGAHRLYASFIGVADLPARRIVALVGVESRREDAWGAKAAAPAFATLVKALR